MSHLHVHPKWTYRKKAYRWGPLKLLKKWKVQYHDDESRCLGPAVCNEWNSLMSGLSEKEATAILVALQLKGYSVLMGGDVKPASIVVPEIKHDSSQGQTATAAQVAKSSTGPSTFRWNADALHDYFKRHHIDPFPLSNPVYTDDGKDAKKYWD